MTTKAITPLRQRMIEDMNSAHNPARKTGILGYARIRFPHVSFNIGAALTQAIFEINGASRRP